MKNIKRTDYQKPFIILFVLGGLSVAALSLGLFLYYQSQLQYTLNQRESAAEYTIKKNDFDRRYNRFKSIVSSITNNTVFLEYVDNTDDIRKYKHASELFKVVASSHINVMQLRYLDASGYERIRIDRPILHGNVNEIPHNSLQDKSQRYYFKDTSLKKENEFFVSKIDLNVEHGKVEMPLKATWRIALPVYRNGVFKGIVIVNLYMTELLRNLIHSSTFYTYVYDQDNYILTSNDPEAGEWGRYLAIKKMIRPEKFLYTKTIYSSELETISIGFRPKEEPIQILVASKNVVFILFGIIIPIGFVFAYLLARIPKKLFDALEERESLMIQQSKMAAMGEMVGAIAHQWRQPLNAIGVLAQEIEYRYDYGNLTQEELKTIVNELLDYLEYMSKTIDDFRNFFKPAKQKSLFNVFDALNASVQFVDKQMQTHNISVDVQKSFENTDSDYEINGYENEFRQAIINLLNNAKEAMETNIKVHPEKEKGYIHIILERVKDKIIIRVRDSGGGISEDILEHIFDLYVSTKYEQQGTGLGLYLAKLIIERNMHGSISAYNIQDGAEFKIILPI